MTQATLLDGIVVLDATQVMAGPYCAMLLADMGARVIKVEPPDGDSTRSMAGAQGDDSAAYNAVNRGKQGIVLDLAQDKGRSVFKRLARGADIVIENYRPGVMARLGLDYEALRAEHPRPDLRVDFRSRADRPLGAEGRLRSDRAGPVGPDVRDRNSDERAGQGGRADHRSGRRVVCLVGILAALHHRSKTGVGQHIDTSLVDAGLALSVWEVAVYFTTGQVPAPLGSAHRLTAPYQAFRVRRRLHHDRRRQRPQLHQAGPRTRPPRVADRRALHRQPSTHRASRGTGATDRR